MWPNCCGRCRSEISAGMPIFSSSWRSNACTSWLAGRRRLGGEFEIDQRRGDEFDGGKALVEFARGQEALQEVVRQRLAGLVMPRELPQHLRLLLPVLVKLRGQLDEI